MGIAGFSLREKMGTMAKRSTARAGGHGGSVLVCMRISLAVTGSGWVKALAEKEPGEMHVDGQQRSSTKFRVMEIWVPWSLYIKS